MAIFGTKKQEQKEVDYKVDASSANPSIKILNQILEVLGVRLSLVNNFTWDRLAAAGAPLYGDQNGEEETSQTKSKPTLDDLRILMAQAIEAIEKEKFNGPHIERKKEALQAMFFTLKTHYPSIFKKWTKNSNTFKTFSQFKITGRHIKLKRIVLARFKEYFEVTNFLP